METEKSPIIADGFCIEFNPELWQFYKPDLPQKGAKVKLKPDFEAIAKLIKGSKCVDLIGVYKNTYAFLIECKKFTAAGQAGQNPKPSYRATLKDNYESIPQKMRDSLAAILKGARNSSHEREFFQNFVKCFQNADFFACLWVIHNKSKLQDKHNLDEKNVLDDELTKNLSWLDAQKATIIITSDNLSNFTAQFEGLTITIQ